MYRTSTLIDDCRVEAGQGAVAENGILKLMPTFTPEIIHAAIDGFEQQKVRIDAQIAQLRAMLPGGSAGIAAAPGADPAKRKMSAAARRRMALGQQRRWAATRGTAEPASQPIPAPSKPKRKMSAAGKAAIAAAQRKRWGAKRAEAAGSPSPTRRRAAKRAAVRAPRAKAARKAPAKKVAAKKAAAKVAVTTPAPAA